MRLTFRTGAKASAATVACFLLASIATGCGGSDGLAREAVSGEVNIDGVPLKSGLITFLPASSDVPTQGGGPVVDGKYSIPKNQGLVPGSYKIVISSPEDKPEVIPDKGMNNDAPGLPPIPAKEVVPAQYNNKSVLTRDVTAGSKNVFIFDLTAKAPAGATATK